MTASLASKFEGKMQLYSGRSPDPRITHQFPRTIWLLLLAVSICCLGMGTLRAAGVSTNVTVGVIYDGNGNVTQRTDGNGLVTAYTYDAANRLISITYPSGTIPNVAFTYDSRGRVTSYTDATGTTRIDYAIWRNEIGRIRYPGGGEVNYYYDDAGNIISVAGSLQNVSSGATYRYDANGRMTKVEKSSTDATTYTYDAAGHVSRRVLANGVTTDYGYDGDGRLIRTEHRKSDSSLICKYEYTLNAIGNKTSITETTPQGTKTTSYTYDALDRLDTVTYPDGRFVDYDYDSFGNRTKLTETINGATTIRTYLYDTDSRLLETRLGGLLEETFYYDATGNMIQRVRASDNRQIDYLYDIENRLVRYSDPYHVVEYVYDAMGKRVARIVDGIQTSFLNDPNRRHVQVLAEAASDGSSSREYFWGNELIRQQSGASRSYYLKDSINGSVRRLVDSTATTVNTYDYDAFGSETVKVQGVANDYQFHGEVQEEETGMVFLRARYFLPQLGRFLTRDPIIQSFAKPQSINPYLFVGNEPIDHRDPSGTITQDDVIGGIGEMNLSVGLYNPGEQAFPDERRAAGESGYGIGYVQIPYGASWQAVQYIYAPKNQSYYSDYLKLLDAGRQAAMESALKPFVDAGNVVATSNSRGQTVSARSPFERDRQVGGLPPGGGSGGADIFGNYSNNDFLNNQNPLSRVSSGKPGGVALAKTAEVLLDINNIVGATYDDKTGQLLLYGKGDATPTALPPMSIDDLAIAFRAVSRGTVPVLSIEDPVVNSPPGWPGRDCFTVRYGPFITDPVTSQKTVLDVGAKTYFGWIMFESDRLMKNLMLARHNETLQPFSSAVPGYRTALDLIFQYSDYKSAGTKTRFWLNPKEIVVEPSTDGKAMEVKTASMQVSTETLYASNGQLESTPDHEYFANWFTTHYDALAEEQTAADLNGVSRHYLKDLKQLAYVVGVVRWMIENGIPLDLSFLESHVPQQYAGTQSFTPQTSVTETRGNQTWTVTGGASYTENYFLVTGGNPGAKATAALTARPGEESLGWTCVAGADNYNVTAVSPTRTAKDGAGSVSAVDASFNVNGANRLELARYWNSFDLESGTLGKGWSAEPYSVALNQPFQVRNIVTQQWQGDGNLWFINRKSGQMQLFQSVGTYNRQTDGFNIASRFSATSPIVVYLNKDKDSTGWLLTDQATKIIMRPLDGTLLTFDLAGRILEIEDPNGKIVEYVRDGTGRLTAIRQPGGRTITLQYDGLGRISGALLPDGRSVVYSYDASGDLVTAQLAPPGGRAYRYAYDSEHRITQVQDENGAATSTQVFDIYGRVATTSQPGVATALQKSFSLQNGQTAVSGPENTSALATFDAEGRVTERRDARSAVTKYSYNRFGEVTTVELADGQFDDYYYNQYGLLMARLRRGTFADCSFFGPLGKPLYIGTNIRASKFVESFDADHRIDWTKETLTRNVHLKYLTYDSKGNLTSVADLSLGTWTFAWDANGNRVWAKDALQRRTDYTYDSFSRLTDTSNELGHHVGFSYDTHDNLLAMQTAAGSINYTYSAKDQLSTVTRGDSGARRTTSFTYNARGQLSSVTDPAGAVTGYTYDTRGNLITVTHSNIPRFSYEYDGLNRLAATHYTGTAGGARPSLIITGPGVGSAWKSTVNITWATRGDWAGNENVTIQYSLDGVTWTSIATVNHAAGSYTWTTSSLVGNTVRLRFIRPGDANFSAPTSPVFTVSDPPAAPTMLTATDGSINSMVRVQWQASVGATGYRVFRTTGTSPASAVLVGSPSGSTFDDTTADQGVTYNYWVTALGGFGESDFSLPDAGTRGRTYVPYGWGAGSALPVRDALTKIRAVAAGMNFSVALREDGTVFAWGINSSGQCNVPASHSNVNSIASGFNHTIALKHDGTVFGWGWNNQGSLNIPSGLTGIVQIAVSGNHNLVLRSDGTVATWGGPTLPANLTGVAAIAAGNGHGLALKNDGTLVTWGSNFAGQTTLPSGLSSVRTIAASGDYSVALKLDGTVVVWGDNSTGQRNVPVGLSNVTAIAAGRYNLMAKKADGSVVVWGSNGNGQCNPPAGLSSPSAMALGDKHALVASETGDVVAWGGNDYSQSDVPPGRSQVISIAPGEIHTALLSSDGTVTVLAQGIYPVSPVPSDAVDVVAIAAGYNHTLALRKDGTVKAWGGYNNYGQLNVPSSLTNVVAVSAGVQHSVALKASGDVVVWGGTPGGGQANIPAGLTGVTAISAGLWHTLAVKSNGTVVAWGFNSDGQCSVPAGLTGVSMVAGGGNHSLALKSDGTVVAWGLNFDGQCNVPSGLTGVVAIAAGAVHSLALKNDGTLVAWGNNSSGQRDVPGNLPKFNAIAAKINATFAWAAKPQVAMLGSTVAVAEGGASGSYSVLLTTKPTANVTVILEIGSQLTASPAQLTFTPANWNTPQTVTVAAVDDMVAEGTHTGTISRSVVSSDVDYNAVPVMTVSVPITDNDAAGVIINESSGTTLVTEGGVGDTYTVALPSRPSADVVLSLSAGSELTTSPAQLIFTATNWNVPQTVTVSAVDDSVAEGNHTGTITHTALSDDPNYNLIAIASVTANIADNDLAGVIITESGGSTAATEGGLGDTYTVALSSQPTADVTLTVSPNAQVQALPITLLFSRAQWNVPKVVTVNAIDDGIAEGDHAGQIAHTVASADLLYQSIGVAPVTVAIADKQIRYVDWASQRNLVGANADHHANPSGDGVNNLLKFAFNLDPAVADGRIMQAGAGTSGLPLISHVGGRLRVEYLRRRNAPNISYTVELSSALESAWIPSAAPEAVTIIDNVWERVTVLDGVFSQRFGRLRIVLSP